MPSKKTDMFVLVLQWFLDILSMKHFAITGYEFEYVGKKTNDPFIYIFHLTRSVTKMTEFRFIKYKCKIICFLEICQSYFRCGQRLEYKHRKKCVLEMFTITIHRHEQLTALETTSLRPPDNFMCFCFHLLILTASHR